MEISRKRKEFIDNLGVPIFLVVIGALLSAVGGALGASGCLIITGAILSAIGAFWAQYDQNASSKKLNEKNEEIAQLNKHILNAITGGPTICYLMPDGNRPDCLSLVTDGDFPLYDVSVSIFDVDLCRATVNQPLTMGAALKNQKRLNIGNLPPKCASPIGSILDLHGESRSWNIFFTVRNGFFTQLLRMKNVNGVWMTATKVISDFSGKSEVVFEKISPDFPRQGDGSIDWS